MNLKYCVFSLCLLVPTGLLYGGNGEESVRPAAQAVDNGPSDTLQTDDELTIHSLVVKELADKAFRIDSRGEVNFPLVGRLMLAGKTVSETEQLLISKLTKYYLEPDLEVSAASIHTEPVSVIGAVGMPGIRPMKGKMTLMDALSASGGVRPDAGAIVVVTREAAFGPIEYPGVRVTSSGESVAEVDIKRLLDGQDPHDNFLLKPHDVISIPPAELVYVQGNVKHPGGFPLGGKTGLSVVQALALAEGIDPRAAPQRAHILRHEGETKLLIPVNLKAILAGTAEDISLKPNDVLFVPNSNMKVITTRTIEAAISIATGFLIFH
jgi:polysaccharide biosynthesis/export protein